MPVADPPTPSPHGGRPLVAIPGPSVVPDRVLAAMHRSMPNIYEGELLEVSDAIFEALPPLARTSGRPFVAIANGHGAWEMALTNTLSRGQRVLVCESGLFAGVWGEMAAFDGLEVEVLHAPPRRPVDLDALGARLAADTDRSIAAILVAHVDTASSVRNDVAAIRPALDALDHPALVMVDAIASLGCERYEMDAWGVDVTVAASQKGLMTPPGLGLVWAGERALAAHRHADLRTKYWDWTSRATEGPHYLRYAGTPPVTHLFGLHEALTMLDEEGLGRVWERHELLASSVRAAVAAWAHPDGLELEVVDPTARSNAVTTVRTNAVDPVPLRAWAAERAGVTLGIGLGADADRKFRFGHMGHLNASMLLGTLGTVEAALLAHDAPIGGSGVAAAAAELATHGA